MSVFGTERPRTHILPVAVLVLACGLAGCGQPAEDHRSATTATRTAEFTIVPMTVSSGAKSAELKPDGQVISGGRVLGKFVGSSFTTPDGHSLSVSPTGALMADGKEGGGARFTEEDELVGVRNLSLRVDDDGTVRARDDGGKLASKMVVTGFKPEARRTAAILVVTLLSAGDAAR